MIRLTAQNTFVLAEDGESPRSISGVAVPWNTEARSYRDISTDPITGAPSLVDLTPPGLKARIVAVEDRLAQLNAVASGSANSAQFDATKQ